MDPYLTLGLEKGCNREEVKEAFRLKVQYVHPDHGGEHSSFIELRNAYEQILAELDQDHDRLGTIRERATRVESRSTVSKPRVDPQNYQAWFRNVAVQADRQQPFWQSTRLRMIGLTILLSIMVVNLVLFLIVWKSEPSPNVTQPDDPPTSEKEDFDSIVDLTSYDSQPIGERTWQAPPPNPSDFFLIPYNGTLFLAPMGGFGGNPTELGILTSQGDILPIFSGLPNRPNPAREVEVGPVAKGAKLRIYLRKNDTWTFSDAASSPLTRECFSDRDNSLGGGGTIIEKTSGSTWILHLDDVDSTDDDDEDIRIRIRLGPSDY